MRYSPQGFALKGQNQDVNTVGAGNGESASAE
jgi:hypothetical protein